MLNLIRLSKHFIKKTLNIFQANGENECLAMFKSIEQRNGPWRTSKGPVPDKMYSHLLVLVASEYYRMSSRYLHVMEEIADKDENWTRLANEIIDTATAKECERYTLKISSYVGTKAAADKNYADFLVESVELCYDAVLIFKSAMEAFEDAVSKGKVYEFDVNRLSIIRESDANTLLGLSEMRKTVVAINDLQAALVLQYLSHFMKTIYTHHHSSTRLHIYDLVIDHIEKAGSNQIPLEHAEYFDSLVATRVGLQENHMMALDTIFEDEYKKWPKPKAEVKVDLDVPLHD